MRSRVWSDKARKDFKVEVMINFLKQIYRSAAVSLPSRSNHQIVKPPSFNPNVFWLATALRLVSATQPRSNFFPESI
jgi:hypothetical protein